MSEFRTYSEKLRDPRWQRRRLEVMSAAGFACEQCGCETRTLNVHHLLYRKGAEPWDYSDAELACVCEDCHTAEHEIRDRLSLNMRGMTVEQLERLLGYSAGLLVADGVADEVDADVLASCSPAKRRGFDDAS